MRPSRRPEQKVLGARADLQHEIEQIVRLVLLLAEFAAPASPVCLIEHNGPVLTRKQVAALVGVVEDQAGGRDGDSEGAAGDVLRPACLDDMALRIDPDFLVRGPHRAGYTQLVCEFYLPLQGEGRGAEDQHRPIVKQRRDHGARRKRQRLPDTDLVG
jgi:hypothetical protein